MLFLLFTGHYARNHFIQLCQKLWEAPAPQSSCVTAQYMASNLQVQKSKWLKQQLDVLLPSCKINVVNDCVKLFVEHRCIMVY